MRRFTAVLSVVTLLAAGCGGAKKTGGAQPERPSTTQPQGPQDLVVQIDGKTEAFTGAFTAFFPDDPSAHPGDTVRFRLPHYTGEDHTVALGSLVDAAVKKLEELGPTASIASGEHAPEMRKLPDPFPHDVPFADVGGGPPALNQSAAQPCFLVTGEPPLSEKGGARACPKAEQAPFDGTQTFYDSGVLTQDGDEFSVKLADQITPGTYQFMCLIHRGAMTGRLTVAPKEDKVPAPAEVAARGRKQLDSLVEKLQPVATSADQATVDKAFLGAASPKVFNAQVAQFGPKTIRVPVGGEVTWNVINFHSLTFNAADSDVGVLLKAPDGMVRLNPKATTPAGFSVPPEAVTFPPPDTGTPVTIDGGTWDGQGFRSTGVIGSLPPVLVTVKQTFTKPGTFPVRCLVHPDMKGEVKVG